MDASKEELDRFIAQSISSLSVQERQSEIEELHGVSQLLQEDQNSVERSLQELDTRLNAIKNGSCYEVAEAMDTRHVANKNFRLMFLRADRYDSVAAATRMIRFFDMKECLFGREKLVRDITFSDLDEDDREVLRTGSVQVLDRKDTAGRQILMVWSSKVQGHSE